MADPVDRDRQVDQLLRRVLPARPSTACVDAERLAAWADGGLPASQAAHIERHLADCADCQAMLAAFVEAEPPAASPVSAWHRWRLQWFVPIAAASVVVLAWTMVSREPDEVLSPSNTVARVEPTDAPKFESAAPVAPAAGAASSQQVSPELDSTSEGESGRTAVMPPLNEITALPADEVASMPAPAGDGQSMRSDSVRAPSGGFTTAAPEVLLPARPPTTAAPPPAAPAVPTPQGVAVPAAGTGAQTVQESARRAFTISSAPTPMMELVTADATLPTHARGDPLAPVDFRAPATVASATSVTAGPSSTTTWRLQPDGRLLRSSDAGRTWNTVGLDQAVFVTAGSAPVEDVCWVVARDGAVWRSTNGVDFQRTAFSASAVPVSVLAVDAMQATVVTEAGRVFMTTDGGVAWTQMP